MSDETPRLADDRVPEVLERLFRRVDASDRLHGIHLDVVALRGEVRAGNVTLEGVTKTVYGNGTPGLKTDVDRLVQDLLDRRWRDRALWAVVLTTLSGVVLLLIQTFVIGGKP